MKPRRRTKFQKRVALLREYERRAEYTLGAEQFGRLYSWFWRRVRAIERSR